MKLLSLNKKTVLIIIFLSLVKISSFSANYYISTSGSDSNLGTTVGSPKLTLASVFSTYNLGAGDIINVAAGTYSEKGISVGSNDEGFSISGAPLVAGVPSSIFSSNQTAGWLTISDANNDNITISRIKVLNYKASSTGSNEGGSGIRCWIDGVTGLSLSYCFFDNCDAPASGGGGTIHIKNYSAPATISLSNVTICNSNNPNSGAVLVESTQDIDMTFVKCKLYSNTSGGSGSAFSILAGAGSSVTFTNCLLYKNNITSSGGHGALWIDYTNKNTTLSMTNCTVYNNTAQSSYCGGVYTGTNSTLKNCIIYGNTWRDVVRNYGTVTLDYSFYTSVSGFTPTNSSTSDPQLNNIASDDYSLASGSRSIDFGNLLGAPSDDIRNYSRVNNPDAGAFESNGVLLPIELLNFNGEVSSNSNFIFWSTASECDNDYFVLEKSIDGINWIVIDRVKGQGNSHRIVNYNFTDYEINSNVSYYKLIQVDLNGKIKKYSPISLKSNFGNSNFVYKNQLGQQVDYENSPSGVYLKCFEDGTSLKVFKN